MKEFAPPLILIAVFVALIWLLGRHDPHPLLIDAAATPCTSLPNPCDRVNCNRVRTEKIA